MEVEIEKLFYGLARTNIFIKNWINLFKDLPTIKKLRQQVKELRPEPDIKIIDFIEERYTDVRGIGNELTFVPHLSHAHDDWFKRVEAAVEAVKKLFYWLWEEERKHENQTESGRTRDVLQRARESAHVHYTSIKDIQSRFKQTDIIADKSRVGFVYGAAGSGKSHLFADAVAQALNEKRPAILILGQYIRSDDLRKTILNTLDLPEYSFSKFLKTLDSAAETARTRCLILIDALNDATDLRIWRDRLGGLITDILKCENLAVAFSCRSEYVDNLVTKAIKMIATSAECVGFVTSEEKEMAAKQYMEKRNIIRPATPWLSQEFKNPLFLKTCCDALHNAGKTQFPRGIHGIMKLLGFYIDSIQKRIEQKYPDVALARNGLENGIFALAKWMAENRKDHVPLIEGTKLLNDSFYSISAPENLTWIETLVREGVLRKDIDKSRRNDNLFQPTEEIYQFAYQRFSDHLIVKALLHEMDDPTTAFECNGQLSYLIKDNAFEIEWLNLLSALLIQVPEKYGSVELIDILPGDREKWWNDYVFQTAFEESIQWRSTTAFSDNTLDLLNKLDRLYYDKRIELFLQLSVISDHPWNAKFIDNILNSYSMPERDSFWSIELAKTTSIDNHSIHTLIDWALNSDKSKADKKTMQLTTLILAWCLTTSSRPIRDRATKALSAVFTEKPSFFIDLLVKFSKIDDLYLLERLCAAGYGCVCRGVDNAILSEISKAVYEEIFKDGSPPTHLLLRDYALGIMELAFTRECLHPSVDMEICRPPFKSDWPLKNVTEDDLAEIREIAGDDRIYISSCKSGDFERYEIEPNIISFTATLLTEPRPMNAMQKLDKFKKGINKWPREKQVAFAQLKEAIEQKREHLSTSADDNGLIRVKFSNGISKKNEYFETKFIEILSPEEENIYRELVVPSYFPDRVPHEILDIRRFDVRFAKRWISKRAHDFGWTKTLFPEEPTQVQLYRRRRPIVERIGKKYQWLALYELMARLADHVWLVKDWPDEAIVYGHACHTSTVRDIEPTVLKAAEEKSVTNHWWFPSSITYESESDESVARWPFDERDYFNSPELIDIKADDESRWLVLHSMYVANERNKDNDSLFRRMAFVRVITIIVKKSEVRKVVGKLTQKCLTDYNGFHHLEVIDGPYYFEYPWRNTWKDYGGAPERQGTGALEGIKYYNPVMYYAWEDHLDMSLPEGCRALIPSLWLAERLDLKPRPSRFGEFDNNSGQLIFIDPSVGSMFMPAALIERQTFLNFLKDNNLDCLWIVAGQKEAFPGKDYDAFGKRWHSAIYRISNEKWIGSPWYGDEKRGLEKYLTAENDG